MLTVTYYAFDDADAGGLNFCSREVTNMPIAVNCTGLMNLDQGFTTYNQNTRLDYYLIYISSGGLLVDIGSKEVFAESGDFILFPPKYKYKYTFSGNGTLSYYYAHFSGTYVKELLKQLSLEGLPGVWHAGRSEKTVNGFNEIFSAFSVDDKLRDLKASAALQTVLISLSGDRSRADNVPPLNRSLSYIKAFYTDDIRIPELAKLEGLSVSRYNTLFKMNMDMPPIHYITLLRMKHAASLLTSTDLDVKTIGELVGYEDNHFFSKIFKKYMGVSPMNYRKSK